MTYSVDLSSGITESFFENIQRIENKNLIIRKRLTEIAIELLQNIKKHGVTSNRKNLTIEKHESHYCIQASNQIHAHDVNELKSKIIHINSLDRAQLKKHHTRILHEGKLSEKSGAGLGLYRIVLRAQTVQASIIQTNQDYFTFIIHVNLAV